MMRSFACLCLLLLAWTGPAVAFVSVIGTGDAALCAQYAKGGRSMASDAAVCTRAIEEGQLSTRDRAATHVNRGILRTHGRKYDLAEDDFQRALALIPELPEAHVGLGNVAFKRKDFEAALAQYQRALDLGIRDRPAALFNRGLAFEKLKAFRLALIDFRAVAAALPEFRPVQFKLEQFAAAGYRAETLGEDVPTD